MSTHSLNTEEETESLDSEISTIRAELQTLHHRRRILTNSLLTSRPFQRLAKSQSQSQTTATAPRSSQKWTDLSPLLHSSALHADLNHHRIAFSTTAFPFTDPSPSPVPSEAKKLIGLRIDICARDGSYVKPYYILLRKGVLHPSTGSDAEERTGKGGRVLYVHRHTVPPVVDVGALERVYLPRAGGDAARGEEGEQLKPWKRSPNKKKQQDLKGFLREVRRQLVVWHVRCDGVRYLRERLGVVKRGEGQDADADEENGVWERDVLAEEPNQESRIARNDLGIVALAATALEAVYVRVEWADGRVGRFKISNAGLVERAVVMGDTGRDKLMEAVMTGGNGRLETLLDRWRKHASELRGSAAAAAAAAASVGDGASQTASEA